MFKHLALVALAWLSCATPALAQTPVPLKPWEAWASAPFAYRECAIKPGLQGASVEEYACQWPGELRLKISARAGEFSQSWQLDQKGAVALPGSKLHWPQKVRVDGNLAPVVEQNGIPIVRLEPGKHVMSGQWEWEEAPSSLDIPEQTAWWTVFRDGKGAVRRQGKTLLLEDHEPTSAPAARNSLNLRVFRKWTDGQVPMVDVRMQFNAGGAPREVVLGPVVDPSQWQPVNVQSAWPVQWQADGKLRVQIQPGSNDLVLSLRCTKACAGPFARPDAASPWPTVEYWALQSDPAFRVVAWEGQAVDPRQVAAPNDWSQLPWIVVNQKSGARWTVKSRGPAEKDAPLLLSRVAWLDFDGSDWWVIDSITGPAPKSNRLNALAPYKMLTASQQSQPVLVSEDHGKSGVELRNPQLSTQVLLRQPSRAPEVPIAGVGGEFSQVDWTLHMPAGYQVLFAPGTDEASQVWWNRWRLTQVLSVALLLVLSWRWAGWRALVPAALLILLSFHTPGLPLWSWGFVLGLGLLSHAGLPEKLRRVFLAAWRSFLVLWVLLASTFAIHQILAAMHPEWVYDGASYASSYQEGPQVAHDVAPSVSEQVMGVIDGRNRATKEAASSMGEGVYNDIAQEPASAAQEARMDRPAMAPMPVEAPPAPAPMPVVAQPIEETGTRISAGPGRPSWSARNPVHLSWQGPITSHDTVKLWIVGPFLVGLGRWLSVALLLLVGWSLWKRKEPLLGKWKLPLRSSAALLLLGLALPVMAQTQPPGVPTDPVAPPGSSWMDRLGQEKHPIPDCAPDCVSIASARLSVSGSDLVMDLEAHAQARAALPLPMDADQALVLKQVQQEGQALAAILMEGDQSLVQLPKGVSRVHLVFATRAASGTLRFAQSPGSVQIDDSSGWTFSGIDHDRLSSGVLGWQRVADTSAKGAAKEQGNDVAVAPFVQVNRTLVLGPKWEIQTQVLRLAPGNGAFVAHIPLLQGEQPRQDLPRDDKGLMIVSFQSGQSSVEWNSDMASKTRIELTAPQPDTAIERWIINPSQRFHVQASGLPSRADAPWMFQPLPGEKLALEISEPKALDGQTVAVDSATVSQQWGPRGQSIDLMIQTRATTTTDLTLTVPKGLDLVEVSRNGAPLAGVRVEGGKLLLPVLPGQQQWMIGFRNNEEPAMKVGTPQFSLNAPIANLSLAHTPGEKRWVLGTPGPGKAPAVAYWPWLLVLMLSAWLMGQWRHSPLKTWQWVLLGLGFSVAAPWKIALVGAWLVMIKQRQLHSDRFHKSPAFNLWQVLLVVLTLLAVATIVCALPQSLLASPDMKIYGANGGSFTWFVDQVELGKPWPRAFVISAPMWVYRTLMLAWSLWLAIYSLNWLRDGLRAWLAGGHWHHVARKQYPGSPPAP